jgi:hypothetical protein
MKDRTGMLSVGWVRWWPFSVTASGSCGGGTGNAALHLTSTLSEDAQDERDSIASATI